MSENVNAEIIVGTSKKTGSEYVALDIHFPNGYKKRIFLKDAEAYMAKQCLLEI